jgi:hypothetical protein
MENFGTQLALADLPTTRITIGIEPTAAWRTEAAERIEKLRKADLKVVVKDATGKAIPQAQVTATLKSMRLDLVRAFQPNGYWKGQ